MAPIPDNRCTKLANPIERLREQRAPIDESWRKRKQEREFLKEFILATHEEEHPALRKGLSVFHCSPYRPPPVVSPCPTPL